MSKKQYTSSNSDPSDSEVYEVQKIVNQRSINGKKQYKVVWVGYSFQQATWEPEENLKCPQKINEFLRRYQDVIRRKNLMNKNSNDPNLQPLQKSKATQPQKIPIQKTQPLLQKSLVTQQSNLNKQKLQSSLKKSSVTIQKRVPDIENLKSKIMNTNSTINAQTLSDQHKNQMNFRHSQTKKTNQTNQTTMKNQQQISIHNENKNTCTKVFASSKLSKTFEEPEKPQVTKVIKIQSQLHNKSDSFDNRVQSKIESKLESETFQNVSQINAKNIPSQKNKTMKDFIYLDDNFQVNHILQERKISSQSSQSDSRSQEEQGRIKSNDLFLKVGQRLDIQKILGEINLENSGALGLQNTENQGLYSPKFFLIKNKFSKQQKIVEKQRIILEQPFQLINFYESLLCE